VASRKARRDAREAILAPLGLVAPTHTAPAPRGSRTRGSPSVGAMHIEGDPTVAALLRDGLVGGGPVERATHGFHTYPAGLHPDAARALLTAAPGPVLDPFCGGGTVLVEALLAGRAALGLDISAVAVLVARARTRLTDEAERTALRTGARHAAAVARERVFSTGVPLPDVPQPVARAYERHALVELAAIRETIGSDDGLRAVFSAIVVKASRREGDTSKDLTERTRPPGTTATLFHAKAREYARQLEALAAAVPPDTRARVHREDAREVRLKEPYGLVLSSPPYPGVYDYVTLQALRRFWLALDDSRAEDEEIGARRAFREDPQAAARTWREDTAHWVKATTRTLTAGGRLVVVIGDGRIGRRPVNALAAMEDAARAAGLRRIALASVERWDPGIGVAHLEHAIAWERPDLPAPPPFEAT
jgi:hypothetical protein